MYRKASLIAKPIFKSTMMLMEYNTFGMDFDPITGILWDTENGPKFGDEINMASWF